MHVLVIQRDKSLKLGLAHLVRSFGFSTETAASLEEAADKMSPDVVIVDQDTTLNMGINGIRSLWPSAHNPEVMLIANDDDGFNHEDPKVDQTTLFTHPLDADLLEDRLGSINKNRS